MQVALIFLAGAIIKIISNKIEKGNEKILQAIANDNQGRFGGRIEI